MRRSSALLAATAALVLLTGASNPAPRDMGDLLRGRLVRLDAGQLRSTEAPQRARHLVFYFGAGWCGPCRAFVPELKQAYARLKAKHGDDIEIVFVSDDVGCGAMADYIRQARMPWPALSCRARTRTAWLQKARGAALPGLLGFTDGHLVRSSWTPSGRSYPRDALASLERSTN